MLRSKRTLSLLAVAAFVALTLAAAPSFAVVTYGLRTNPLDPNTAGMDTSPFTTPGSEYYGMNWSYNYLTRGGTSVAIGYFTLLTADHYFMPVGNTFTVNGDTFSITSMETLPPDPGQGTKVPDLRVVHVENLTNEYRPLPGFYDLYTYSGSWPADKKSFVMVGTGDTGSTASLYFYTDTPDTRALRWGTNRYDKCDSSTRRTDTDYSGVTHSTQCIKMSYSRVVGSNTTTYESGIGLGDSGGGVFVKDGDTWKLAGISLYREATSPGEWKYLYAASIPYYASELYDILQYDLLPGDVNLDGNVDSSDYITLKANFGKTGASWFQGDFNNDGLVGYQDLFALETNFGYKSTPHPIITLPSSGYISTGGTSVPEPGSAILLALGAAALLRRRGGESKRWNP